MTKGPLPALPRARTRKGGGRNKGRACFSLLHPSLRVDARGRVGEGGNGNTERANYSSVIFAVNASLRAASNSSPGVHVGISFEFATITPT